MSDLCKKTRSRIFHAWAPLKDLKILFSQHFDMGIKNAEFDVDFKRRPNLENAGFGEANHDILFFFWHQFLHFF